jgi:glutamine amidotransferase
MQIAVVDLGIGNLRSVENALKAVAPMADIIVTANAAEIAAADKVVLPGQGAMGSWFQAAKHKKLLEVVSQTILEKPLLGICVGMQALFNCSEEGGGVDGLGLIDGEVRHFKQFHDQAAEPKLKIPQMGWNQVVQDQAHPMWQGISDNAYFYFVHSYCANLNQAADPHVVFGSADYGHRFIAAVGFKNVFAMQFHPEKSHNDGLQLLKNFTLWNGSR